MNSREIAEQQAYEAVEGYCDYCEREGHTFRSCSARDDDYDYPEEDEDYEIHKMEVQYERYLDNLGG